MNTVTIKTLLITIFAGFFATGCYTQLETVDRSKPVYHTPDRTAAYEQPRDRSQGERPVRTERPEREEQIVNEEDYELGYEDGWEDAESYFFKDYETEQWYNDQGATLSSSYRSGQKTVINNYYGYNDPYFYSPHHYAFYPYPVYHRYPSFRHSFAFSFGFGWGFPGYGFYNPYAPLYTVYPGGFYYPGYGHYFGYGGYTHLYFATTTSKAVRSNDIRTTGLRSSGLRASGRDRANVNRSNIRTTRSDARSNIRTTVRSRQIERSTTRTNVRSGNRSTVRSRGSVRSNSRSNVKRSRSTGSGNNRSTVRSNRSSNNRSSGTVRQRSNSRSSGSGNVKSRGSSSNRSSGSSTVRKRSSGNNGSSGSSTRKRSSNRSSGNDAVSSRVQSQNRDRSTISTGVSGRSSTSVTRSKAPSRATSIIRNRVRTVENPSRVSIIRENAGKRSSGSGIVNRIGSAISNSVNNVSAGKSIRIGVQRSAGTVRSTQRSTQKLRSSSGTRTSRSSAVQKRSGSGNSSKSTKRSRSSGSNSRNR